MNKAQLLLKKHSPTILTTVGATGVIATAVLSVKATPKALLLLEEAKNEKGEELTIKETVQVAWKPYIPAAITGFSTIACIFGANYLNTRSQASLISAYALLDRTYKEYRNKVNEIHGKDKELNIKQEIINTKFDDEVSIGDGKELFFDYQSMRFFWSTMDKVLQAEVEFLESFEYKGYACLNEYYDILGIPHMEFGYQLGWMAVENNDPYNCKDLEFSYEEIEVGDGIKCWIINTNMPPATDYIV